MDVKRKKLSKTSVLHFIKLTYRSALFIAAVVFYIFSRINGSETLMDWLKRDKAFLIIVWVVMIIEMLLRFFPSNIESMGCQKQFKRNFVPTEIKEAKPNSWKSTLAVALSWIGLNAVIGAIYYMGIIDEGILLLISLAFAVCDMICILFFCPFQTWMMKNKCCTDCRIYNWDFAMMFTPLIFIKSFYSLSLVVCSVLLLIRWEITFKLHPERFLEQTNACLRCNNGCREKLCSHKKQLRNYLTKKYRELNKALNKKT